MRSRQQLDVVNEFMRDAAADLISDIFHRRRGRRTFTRLLREGDEEQIRSYIHAAARTSPYRQRVTADVLNGVFYILAAIVPTEAMPVRGTFELGEVHQFSQDLVNGVNWSGYDASRLPRWLRARSSEVRL